MGHLSKTWSDFTSLNYWVVRDYHRLVNSVNALEPQIQGLSDAQVFGFEFVGSFGGLCLLVIYIYLFFVGFGFPADCKNNGVPRPAKTRADTCGHSSWFQELFLYLFLEKKFNSFIQIFETYWFLVMMLEAFAVVREAARRKLGMRHFDVQVSLLLVLFTHMHTQILLLLIHLKYKIELITCCECR